MQLDFAEPERVPVAKLFDQRAPVSNRRGDVPEIDFAAAGPFRLLTDLDVERVRGVVASHRDQAYVSSRSTSLRGVGPLLEMFDDVRLERILSQIAGVDLALHPMAIERAHVNLQSRDDRPVDDWHIDYVPFVCVLMIACSEESGGRLLTRGFGDYALRPGEALLLQGSHVEHRAEAASAGERITVITSLIPAALSYRDCTRVVRGDLPYAPDEPLARLAADYRMARIRRRADHIATGGLGDEGVAAELERLMFDFQRWQDAMPHEAFRRHVADVA